MSDSTPSLDEIAASPNVLAKHYSRFRVEERALLSGHSHQAWPDVALDGLSRAFDDAAEHVDDKWQLAFEQVGRVREGYRRLIDDPKGLYTLAESTHDLLVRLLSALPLRERPHFVTTDLEFHSWRRQLQRLEEEGIEVTRVPALPAESVGERLAAAVSDRTAAVFVSTVFYKNAHIAGDLSSAADAARRHGAILILDLYHQLNAVPFSLVDAGLEDAYAVGGGYKYCQLGEGNGFLRFPPNCELRPIATGWFAEFGDLTTTTEGRGVAYSSGHERFAGATFDPSAAYRGAAVFDFFDQHGLTAEFLREVSQRQILRFAAGFDALGIDPSLIDRDRTIGIEGTGGFLSLISPHAGELCEGLKKHDVMTDFRADRLRVGPAPYVSDAQLDHAISALEELARGLAPDTSS